MWIYAYSVKETTLFCNYGDDGIDLGTPSSKLITSSTGNFLYDSSTTSFGYLEGWNMVGFEIKKDGLDTIYNIFASPNWASI